MSRSLYCPKCQKSAPCGLCRAALLDHSAVAASCPVVLDGRISGYGPSDYRPQTGWTCCVRSAGVAQ